MKILIEVKTNRINRYFECNNLESIFHKILPKIDDLGSYIGCKKTDSTAEDLYDYDYFISISQIGNNLYSIHLFNIKQSTMEMLIQINFKDWIIKFIKMIKKNAKFYQKLITIFKVKYRHFVFENKKEFKFIEIWNNKENDNEKF